MNARQAVLATEKTATSGRGDSCLPLPLFYGG
jgi:hypothetical protein